jgi:hypothetical protein
MNKEELLIIKTDTESNAKIAKKYGVSAGTIFHIKHGIENRMFHSAKGRAKEKGIEFNISVEDIVVPDKCPLLNITLNTYLGSGLGHPRSDSPTLDRKDITLGYVKGNVWVISAKANAIKNSSTFEEFEKVYQNWKLHIK